MIINNLMFLVTLIFHLHYFIHYILIQVAFICLNRWKYMLFYFVV